MLLKECYEEFGGNYEDVTERISNEAIIVKFLKKFLAEPSYDTLCSEIENENYEEAFRAVHSLKGISQNLGFQRLEVSSEILTEYLRNSKEKQIDKEKCEEFLHNVSEDYYEVKSAVERFTEE